MKLEIYTPGDFNVCYKWITEEKYYLLKYHKNYLTIYTR